MNNPTISTPTNNLPKLLNILSQLAEDSQETLKHAIDGNEIETRRGVDLIRQGRAALYAVDKESKDAIDGQPPDVKATIQRHLDSINKMMLKGTFKTPHFFIVRSLDSNFIFYWFVFVLVENEHSELLSIKRVMKW